MKRILVVADPAGQPQHTIRRAARLGASLDATLDVVGFVYEHIVNLPGDMDPAEIARLKEAVVKKHADAVHAALAKAGADRGKKARVEVVWERHIGDWIIRRLKEREYDLIAKGGRRSETVVHTPTDWQLLRGSKVPVLLFAEKRWKKGAHVMATVDLGTRIPSKKRLNYKIVEHAWNMANALGSQLHCAYAIPVSTVLRDLGVLDRPSLRKEGKRRAEEFRVELADRGIEIEGMHVAMGPPEKVLVNLAAKHHARLVVLGCIGRKRLAGRVIGNTAEKILRLLKADTLTIKP